MTTTDKSQASLTRRIRRFYKLLNEEAFKQCYGMIDPRIRATPSSVTLFQYENALSQFLEAFGSVKVVEISADLHSGERTELYGGRDFATGKTVWLDERGEEHVFSERWVRDDGIWHTRCTGLVTPATAEKHGSHRRR